MKKFQMKQHNNQTTNAFNGYATASGEIDYGFRNDYMFRAIFQTNETALKGLVCSLLHLKPESVKSIKILNPIELGRAYDDKEFILDLAILLNDNTYINLELQTIDLHDWPERSLSYLCRSFDQLNKGQAYIDAKPVIHIGILNYTLFKDAPEFYAKYELQNVKNQLTYTGKFALHVLDLTQIDKATAEDKHYAIDKWATLFKATTWEELHMITKNDKAMTEASKTLYEMNADQTIRDMCYFREHAIIEENYRNDLIKRQQAELAEKDSELAEKDSKIAEKDSELAEKDSELTAKDHIIANLMAQLQAKDNE